MMDLHEHIFVVTCRIKGMKFSDVMERFLRRIHKHDPTDNAVRSLVNKYKRTGSVHGENRCGHPGKAREGNESVRQVFEEEQKL
jgi:hypothetical protein